MLMVFVLLLGLMPSAYAATNEGTQPATEPTATEETAPESAEVPTDAPSVNEEDLIRWAELEAQLPDPIEEYFPFASEIKYPYGEPQDNFYPSSLLEADSSPMLFAVNPYAVAPAADMTAIPDEMYDNSILRALEYTGYDVQWLKDNGFLYVAEYVSSNINNYRPDVLSNIGYDDYAPFLNGDETVADSSTVTGRAPDIASFESSGLVCASFVSYYINNYLPNIEGYDTSHIHEAIKATTATSTGYSTASVWSWETGLTNLANTPGSGVTKYTNETEGYANLVPGDIIVFSRDGELVHVAIYAGTYSMWNIRGTNRGEKHFIIHVGNSRGPEISTTEYLAKSGTAKSSVATAWYHLELGSTVDETGFIEVYKKDPNGNNLSGARFKAVDQATGDTYYIGPTDANGYAKSGELPFGTYKITETVFPEGYGPGDVTEWTRTLDKDTPSGTITIYAENIKIIGGLTIQKATNTGENLDGWVFGVYTDAACTNPIPGSPFTTPASGKIVITDLEPGTYYVKETSSSIDYWVTDNVVKSVKVTDGSNETVTVTNTHYGYGKIIKKTNTGSNLSGWKFNVYTDSALTQKVSGSPFTTGSDGIIVMDLLPGTYYVKEVDDSANRPGWSFVTATRKLTVTAGNTSSVTFTNNQYGYAQIVKQTSTGNNLGGWKFNIYTNEACTSLVQGSPFISGDDGSIEVQLAPGTYWVQEIDESAINPDWTYDTTVREVAVTAGQTATVTFTNTHFGYAEIQKVTNTGSNLAGWKFDIYTDADCTQKVTGSPFTTDDAGKMSVRLLPGTYFVQEVDESAANPGWVYDSRIHVVTVKAGETASVTLENQQMGRVKLIKAMPDGGSVSGWIFDIYRKSDNAHIGTYTSGEDGTIMSGYLLPDTYLVYEQIGDDSIYWCESENPQEVTIIAGETAEVTFTNRLKPAEILVYKVNPLGEPLTGAEFLLEWSEDGTVWVPVTYTDSQYVTKGTCTSAGLADGKLVSGEDGIIHFTGLHPEMQYRLTETKAPNGYELIPGPVFTGTIDTEHSLTLEIEVMNHHTYVLPMTGSKSPVIMAVSLFVCIAGCVGALVYLRKKEK